MQILRPVRAALVAFALAGPAAAQPQPLPGQDDPALQAGVARWLTGTDDAGALGLLVAQAQNGNLAAQVFVGVLAQDGVLSRNWRRDIPLRDLRRLLRPLEGAERWLDLAAQRDPLAAALDLGVSGAPPEARRAALERLVAAGEARGALMLLAIEVGRPDGVVDAGLLELAAQPGLRGHGLPLLALLADRWAGMQAAGQVPPVDPAALRPLLDGADPGAVALGALRLAAMPLAPDPDTEARLLATPLLAPLAQLCHAACPEAPGRCVRALATGSGGAAIGRITLSPLEALVDSDSYAASPRFAGDLRAQLALPAPVVAVLDACAAAAVGG